jgi:uncharacterized membrane protein
MVRLILNTARSLALKIASYGVMHLVVAILVAYALTRDWRLALAVGMVEPFFQTIAYSIHDRVWHRIERRKRLTGFEETAEAFTARLELMDAREQARSHGHTAHSHALPTSFKQVALKTLTYGLMHFVVAVTVAYAITRDIRIALAIGIVEPLVQTLFFTVHDHVWSRIEARRAKKSKDLAAA